VLQFIKEAATPGVVASIFSLLAVLLFDDPAGGLTIFSALRLTGMNASPAILINEHALRAAGKIP
jgi:hypothetical protein